MFDGIFKQIVEASNKFSNEFLKKKLKHITKAVSKRITEFFSKYQQIANDIKFIPKGIIEGIPKTIFKFSEEISIEYLEQFPEKSGQNS